MKHVLRNSISISIMTLACLIAASSWALAVHEQHTDVRSARTDGADRLAKPAPRTATRVQPAEVESPLFSN